jgi:ankyrin repeat protein
LLTAVHKGNTQLIAALLATWGVRVDVRDVVRDTPLLVAVRRGNAAIVSMLLATRAVDVNARNDMLLNQSSHLA